MVHQIDCFSIHFKFLKYLGTWCPKDKEFRYYKVFSSIFIFFKIIIFSFLFTINFFYIERQLDAVVEEMLLWLSDMNFLSKAFTFIVLHDDMQKIFDYLESDIFQAKDDTGYKILAKAKKENVFMWKMFSIPSFISYLSYVLPSLLSHFIFGHQLRPPMSSYAFWSVETKERFIYPIYFYQILGIQIDLWLSVTIDSLFIGLLNMVMAQLDILNHNLRIITDITISEDAHENSEDIMYFNLKECILHYASITEFCSLVQSTFSVTLFIQFNIASFVICVCLFRLNLPMEPPYFVFLLMYLNIMVIEILFPCWFGHQIYDKSAQLPAAVYSCNWPARPRRFTSSMRLFIECTSRPLSITGGKLYPLLLTTFTSIANTAYSFYTLLRNVET